MPMETRVPGVGMVAIRMDVEGMKHGVIQSLRAHEDDIQKLVEQCVTAYLENGLVEDVERFVRQAGAEHAKSLVDWVLYDVMKDPAVRADLTANLVAGVRKAIAKAET